MFYFGLPNAKRYRWGCYDQLPFNHSQITVQFLALTWVLELILCIGVDRIDAVDKCNPVPKIKRNVVNMLFRKVFTNSTSFSCYWLLFGFMYGDLNGTCNCFLIYFFCISLITKQPPPYPSATPSVVLYVHGLYTWCGEIWLCENFQYLIITK